MSEGPRRSDIPTPGFYLLRLVKGGPWVGAAIEFDLVDGWRVFLNGAWEGPAHDAWSLSNMERVHWGGRASTEDEVRYRVGLAEWALAYDQSHPAANPTRAVNRDTYVPF